MRTTITTDWWNKRFIADILRMGFLICIHSARLQVCGKMTLALTCLSRLTNKIKTTARKRIHFAVDALIL